MFVHTSTEYEYEVLLTLIVGWWLPLEKKKKRHPSLIDNASIIDHRRTGNFPVNFLRSKLASSSTRSPATLADHGCASAQAAPQGQGKEAATGWRYVASLMACEGSRLTSADPPPSDRNPKAFAFSKPGKLARTAARSQDVSKLSCLGLVSC